MEDPAITKQNKTKFNLQFYFDNIFKILYLFQRKHMQLQLVNWVSTYRNSGSIRDDPYWTSRENSLKLIELSSINKVSLV